MYVRSSLGFDGKLCNAEPETKERFVRFMNNVCAYKKVRVGGSFTKRRISSGRKTLALVAFSGKKIAVAFALDPKRFEDTPYRGKDKSELKRYADTPLLIKLSSERRTEHAIKLFDILAGEVGLVRDENVVPPEYDLVQKSQKELFYGGLLRVKVCGEVVEEQTEVRVSPKKATAPKPVKKQAAVSVDEAKTLLSDEDAAKLVKGKFKRKNGKKFAVNIDTVAAAFKAGERVDIKSLKAKGLVPPSAKQIKVLGRGYIDKPLKVVADDFSYAALKMIIVTGGEAVYCE